MAKGTNRPVWAEINLGAIGNNAKLLANLVEPAALCAVVKADAYGHGAVSVSRKALENGATYLAVAIADEGIELRDAGIDAPIIVLSEPHTDAIDAVIDYDLTPTVIDITFARKLGKKAIRKDRVVPIHVKVDTGMHRLGSSPTKLLELLGVVEDERGLALLGLWTHLAVADGSATEDRDFTNRQLDIFDSLAKGLVTKPELLHASNSAGAICWPRARYDMVRCGIALYGYLPSSFVKDAYGTTFVGKQNDQQARFLQPAMSLHAHVSQVRELNAGERPSYGRLRPLAERSVVATVPIGYGDGVPRSLFHAGGEVLISGKRRPLAGMVTMDQVMVDCGSDHSVAKGDVVTLLGSQGTEEITADEWATKLHTISYEVLCGIGPRVPRIYANG